MISVIEVYNAVRELANKDQKGFVTPAVFNSFADVAQQNVFTDIFSNLVEAKALRMSQRDPGAGESVYRGVEDDLSEYIRDFRLQSSRDPNLTGDSNLFKKPEDFYKLISLRVDSDERTPIELIYRPDQMSHVLSSNLSSPTELFPVALVSKNLEVFPTDIASIIMTYYRYPYSRYPTNVMGSSKGDIDYSAAPRFSVGEIMTNGFYHPNISDCRDFDLPERFKGQVIAEICKMIGVRLRDNVLAQFGQTQTN
tara:strand:- start:216 stop:974 length:759 start_codon:yes stop_codon:yes gene_type:complete